MTTTTYRWDKEKSKFVDKKTGEPMHVKDPNAICSPQICSDLPGYFSVATNRWVDGRRERREDLARAGCVPWEPDSKRYDPKGFGNPRFAKKHGLKLSEEAVHRKRATRIDPFKDIR